MSRRAIITLSVIGGVALLIVIMALSVPVDPLTSEGDKHTLALGPITFPVADPEPTAEDPDQYLGVLHPDPVFDTTNLGTDLNLTEGAPNFAALEDEQIVRPDRIIRAVYLGDDHIGTPVYIYAEGSDNIGNLIAQFFLDERTIFRFGSTYNCCIPGPLVDGEVIGEPILSVYNIREGDTIIVAEWHNLPEDISVVALEVDGEPLGWQTPTSGSAAFRLELPDDRFQWDTQVLESGKDVGNEVQSFVSTLTMIAYDIQGQEQARA